ncbi:MAG: hypothetical protein J6U87_06825 [Clostridia bacterium]|nr:hypothetical protein [Clostridia bacterium]
MVSLVKIDGVAYDVLVTALQEKFEVIEGPNSGYALYRQRELRDITGIKIGHVITFAPDNDPEAFDALTEHLFGAVRPSVQLEVVHGQTIIDYEAAYSTGSRAVVYIDDRTDTVGWSELTVEFRPMETQVNA